jgi:hypothetical protein
MHEEGLDLEDDFAMAFGNVDLCRIKSVNLSGSSVTDRGLEALVRHNLRSLNIHNCRCLFKGLFTRTVFLASLRVARHENHS